MAGRSGSKQSVRTRAVMAANRGRGQLHIKVNRVPDERDVTLEKLARKQAAKKRRKLEPSWARRKGE